MIAQDLINELLETILNNYYIVRDAEVCIDGNNIIQSINPNTFTFQIDKLRYDEDTNRIYIILK